MTYPGIENDQALLAGNPDMAAVEARRKEREEEYGQFVALSEITWGTVLAFAAGDRVPASTVQRLQWDQMGLVATRDSEQGREVLERTDSATPEEREAWAQGGQDEPAESKRSTRRSSSKSEDSSTDQAAPAASTRGNE